MVTIEQIKAGRALINWAQQDLADQTGLSKTAIANVESGKHRPTEKNMHNIIDAFDRNGVEFIDGGVRQKKDLIRIFEGENSIMNFFDDIYLTMRKKGGEILISGSDERDFAKRLGEKNRIIHIDRMEKLNNYKCKCLIKESDQNDISVSYAEYRKIPDDMFSNVPFYIYGSKLAIILWNNDAKVILIDDHDLMEAYKKQFEVIWRTAS